VVLQPPGFPGFTQGRNKYASFSVTPTFADSTDIFVLQEDVPGVSYLVNGVSTPYTVRTETFNQAGKTIKVLDSIFGPVINGAIDNAPGLGKPLALKWTGFLNDTTMEWYATAWFTADATTWMANTKALYNCPPSAIVWAGPDTDSPAVVQAGLVPIRPDGHTGLFPVNSTYNWNTYYVPYSINRWPNTKFFVIGGGRLVGRGYRQRRGLDYEDEYTAAHLQSVLATYIATGNTVSATRMQGFFAEKTDALFGSFLAILQSLPDSAAKTNLLGWNRLCGGASSSCGLWRNWYWQMTKLGIHQYSCSTAVHQQR
jgi:acyl-homoserine lactone acylase PvdQ